MYGKQMHPSNQAFGKWCVEAQFGDIDPQTRSDALWWAEVGSSSDHPKTGLTHPTALRKAYRDQETARLNTDPILHECPTPEATVRLDQRTAERVSKLASHPHGPMN